MPIYFVYMKCVRQAFQVVLETLKWFYRGREGTGEGLAERAGKPTGFSVSDIPTQFKDNL